MTVKANDESKTYGDADPELTATVEGLPEGETIKYTVTREEGENAGEYVISVSGDTEQGDYTVSYVDGLFTVEKRPLTITAASETKVYDGYVLSNEGYTVDGLVEGHTVQSVVHEGTRTDVGSSPM